MAHGLRKISRIVSFPDFCSLWLQIFIWYLVHCFAILRYRLSLDFFEKLWPLDLEKYHELSVFQIFFFLSAYRYSLIFGTLLCHNKIQNKFEFGFDPIEFHEVMAHAVRKILHIVIFFLHFFSPPPQLILQSQLQFKI